EHNHYVEKAHKNVGNDKGIRAIEKTKGVDLVVKFGFLAVQNGNALQDFKESVKSIEISTLSS
ncbi:MAG: hypothetical protein AAGG80_06325, partial [Pseudomonadota bacterium]